MDPLLTTEEVAEFLRVDIVTVRRLVNRGELAAYRIGNEYRFTRVDLEEFIKRQRVTTKEKTTIEPFRSFTERAKHVMVLAEDEAQRLEHNFIGTEHMLLGLVGEGEGVAAQVLGSFGLELDKIRSEIVSILKQGQRKSNQVLGKIKTVMMQGEIKLTGREVVLTGRAKKVLELAVNEARSLGHKYIGTEHLLLGILKEGGGLAVGVMENLGVDLAKVRNETIHLLKHADALRTEELPEDTEQSVEENDH
jgi:excisionase family DNA binding protein